jgi:hypothetical protein
VLEVAVHDLAYRDRRRDATSEDIEDRDILDPNSKIGRDIQPQVRVGSRVSKRACGKSDVPVKHLRCEQYFVCNRLHEVAGCTGCEEEAGLQGKTTDGKEAASGELT